MLGDVGDAATKAGLKAFFDALPPAERCDLARVEPPPIPEPTVTRFPTEPRSHTIVRDTPMEAWSEIIFRLFRFGHRNMVAKKSGPEGRVELQNIKAIVENPQEEPDEILQQYGFSLEKFQGYQRRILDPEKPPISATPTATVCADISAVQTERWSIPWKLPRSDSKKSPNRATPTSRCGTTPATCPRAPILPASCPHFSGSFDGKLTLTATFRSHNAMEAWPENVYGLIAIQRFVAEKAGMEPGPLTVFSHSISIDVSSLEKARKIATSKESDEVYDPATGKHGPRMDPNGAFTTTFDRATWEIVVEHSYNGMKIGEYRGKSAEEIERQLARDVAIVGDLARAVLGPRNRAQGIRNESGPREGEDPK